MVSPLNIGEWKIWSLKLQKFPANSSDFTEKAGISLVDISCDFVLSAKVNHHLGGFFWDLFLQTCWGQANQSRILLSLATNSELVHLNMGEKT